MTVFKSGNNSVNEPISVFFIGQSSFIFTPKNLKLLSPKGTFSKAPGNSNLLNTDLATSFSGDIIIFTGKLELVNKSW